MASKKAKIEEVKIEAVETEKVGAFKIEVPKVEVVVVVPKVNITWDENKISKSEKDKDRKGMLLKGKSYKVSKKDFERIKHLVK